MPWLCARIVTGAQEQPAAAHGLPVLIPFNAEGEAWLRRLARAGDDVQVQVVGHSPKEHRTFMGYCGWIWKARYRDEHPTFEDFREWVSLACGHVKRRTVMVPSTPGTSVPMQFCRVLSWGSDCPQDIFHAFVQRAEAMLMQETGMGIYDYKTNRHVADEAEGEEW